MDIEHTGYRGPLTHGQYLPPGTYSVGDHLDIGHQMVPDELARYLLETGQATVALEKAEELLTHLDDAVEDELPPAEVVVDLGDQPDKQLSEADIAAARAALEDMSVDDLRDLADQRGISLPGGYLKKADLVALLIDHG